MLYNKWPYSSVDRAVTSKIIGHGFESRWGHKNKYKIIKVKELISKLNEYNQEADVFTLAKVGEEKAGVEMAIHYYSDDELKENATELYIGIRIIE